jgi:hypothetical protein
VVSDAAANAADEVSVDAVVDAADEVSADAAAVTETTTTEAADAPVDESDPDNEDNGA